MPRPDIIIRRPKIIELRSLANLFELAVYQHFSYFPDHYQTEIIKQNNLFRLMQGILDHRRAIYIAAKGHQVLGYIIAGEAQGEGHIYWLFVTPEARGEKLGLGLIDKAISKLREQGASQVVLNTHDHEGYYLKHGFISINTWDLHGVPVTKMVRGLS